MILMPRAERAAAAALGGFQQRLQLLVLPSALEYFGLPGANTCEYLSLLNIPLTVSPSVSSCTHKVVKAPTPRQLLPSDCSLPARLTPFFFMESANEKYACYCSGCRGRKQRSKRTIKDHIKRDKTDALNYAVGTTKHKECMRYAENNASWLSLQTGTIQGTKEDDDNFGNDGDEDGELEDQVKDGELTEAETAGKGKRHAVMETESEAVHTNIEMDAFAGSFNLLIY